MPRYEASRPWRPWYNTKRWKDLRKCQLAKYPLCEMCKQQGKVEPATIADHIKPHKGDKSLFFSSVNLQSLCKSHHDGAKQRQEKSGTIPGCDDIGIPLDPEHHWVD
jgi:5-methylcytosine-specific restriction endonuclease McrA